MAAACWRVRMRLTIAREPSAAMGYTSTSHAVRAGTKANLPEGSTCKARGSESTGKGEPVTGVSMPEAATDKAEMLLDEV